MIRIFVESSERLSAVRRQRPVMLAVWSMVALGATSALFAQPAPPLAELRVEDDRPQPDSETVEAATADESSAPEATADDPPVRRLYVPVDELNAVLGADNAGVLLTQEEFRELWHDAKTAETTRPRHPASIVLSSADYSARVEGAQLRLSAEIGFRQFAAGWRVVRIPVGGLNVEGASLDGAAAAIARDLKQPDTLLLFSRAQGPRRLTLDLSAEITPVGSDGTVKFALAGAPSGTLLLSLPEDETAVVDGLAVPASETGAGEASYRIPVGGRSQISLRITQGAAAPSGDALLVATTAYTLHAAPGEVTWTTHSTVTVYGQPRDELTFSVPRELDVTGVESEGLASWDINDAGDGDRRDISLTYRQPFSGPRVVTIHGLFAADDEEWSVPTLWLAEADSHIGSVRVEHEPGIRLQPEHGADVRPAAAGELPHAASGADSRPMGFRWTQEDFELSFFTPRKAGVMIAAMTNLLHISDEGLDLTTVIDVEAAVSPLFEIRLTLPAEFELTAVAVAGQAQDWTLGMGEVGLNDIRIALASPLMPGESRRVDFAAHADPEDWPVESNPVLLSIPQVGLPQADMLEARYGVTTDSDLDVTSVDLDGLTLARGADAAALRRLVESSGRQLSLVFTLQDGEFSGELDVSRPPAVFSVATASLSRLEPQRTVTHLDAAVAVEAGGLEGLLIELPEDVTPEARFVVVRGRSAQGPSAVSPAGDVRAPAIVEQTVSDGLNGQRTWALRFDQRLHGTHQLTAVLTQPRSDDAPVTLPTPLFVGADREHGWIAVAARDDQRLAVRGFDAVGQPLRDVDPIDLPGMDAIDATRRRIVAGFHFSRPGATATITEEQFERAAVPTAIADRFAMDSVIGPAGEWQHRLDVAFRAVGVQSLQFALPEHSALWAVTLDGRPHEVRRSPQGYQVPLTSTASPDVAHKLQLFYRTQNVDLQADGRLQQVEPQLAIRLGDGKTQPIDMLSREWTLQYPRDLVLLDNRGRFLALEPLQDDTLFHRVWESLSVPSLEGTGVRVGIAAAVLLLAWPIALIRRATRRSCMLAGGTVLVGLLILLSLFYLSATYMRGSPDKFATTAEFEKDIAAEELAEGGPVLRGIAAGSGVSSGTRGGSEESRPREAVDRLARPERSAEEAEVEQRAPMQQAPMAAPADEPAAPPVAGIEVDGISPDSGVESAGAGMGLPVQQTAESLGVRGALLSLSLDMETPREYRRTVFRSLGTALHPEQADLDVTYASRSYRTVMSLIVGFGVLLAMWWMRAANASLRGILIVLTVILPLAVVTVMPPLASMIVEGVLLGGVAGVILWSLRALIGALLRWSSRPEKAPFWSSRDVAGLVLLSSLFGGLGAARAEEPSVRKSPGFPMEDAGDDSERDVPTVIVPYADDDPFLADRVFVPRALFDELQSQAHPDAEPTGPAPLDGIVAEANYAVAIGDQAAKAREGSSLELTGRYVLHSFREHPVTVLLPIDRIAVVKANLDDQPALVRPAEKDRLEVLIPERGRHELEITFQIPADVHANSGEFVLPLLPVAAGRLTVTLPPRDDWAVAVERNGRTPIGYRRRSPSGGDVTVEVPIDRGGDISVSWQPQRSADGRSGIVNVDSMIAVQIDDRGVHLRSVYDISVRQGTLAQLVFSVPIGVRLMRLAGADVGGWQLEDGDEERTLTILLRRPIDDATRISAELFLPETARENEVSFTVPALAVRDVTRESGEIALFADDVREVHITAAEGLQRTHSLAGELSPELNPDALPVRGTFRFSSRGWRLSLRSLVRPQETRVTALHGMDVGRRKILLGSRLRFELSGAPQRRLRVLLPHDFLLVDLDSDDIEEWFVEGGELVLDLGEPRIGPVDVTFEGHIPRFEGDQEAVLETPLPLAVSRQESRLAIWIDEGLSATLEEFEGWRPLPPDELSTELRSLHIQPVQFAFRSTEIEPELIILRVDPAQPRLVCDAITLIAASDTSVDYGLTLRWTIERAAVDRLTFTTPDWLEGRLEFTGEGIRRASSEFLEGGRIRWTVSLENAVRGRYLVSAVATLPPPAGGIVTAPQIHFEQPAGESDDFIDVPLQESFAVLVNLSGTQITAVEGESHDEVRPSELPFTLRSELLAQAMEVVRLPPGESVAWQMQPVTEQKAATATVTSADLSTVLAADGSWRMQATYRVRNRGHQFLAVRIPAAARLLSVLAKGEPVRVLRTEIGDEPVALVPLPQTSAADLSFEVVIVLQGQLTRPLSRVLSINGDRVAIPAPAIIPPRRSAEYGVPVVHASWRVSIPEKFRASLVTEEGLSNVSQLSEGGEGMMPYFQQLQELADLNRLVQDSAASLSQRKRAADNIRNLGAKLQMSTDLYSRAEQDGKRPALVPEELLGLAQQQEQLLSESLQNADELEGALSSQAANGILMPDQTRGGRSYIAGNTLAIQQDNAGAGIDLPAQEAGAKFGFAPSKADDDRFDDRGGPAQKPKSQQSRSLLKERLSRQEPLFENAPLADATQDADPRSPQSLGEAERFLDGAATQPLQLGRGGVGGGVPDLSISGTLGFDFSPPIIGNFVREAEGAEITGGLSLPVEIPIDGHTLSFSKLGGEPKLTLAFQPKESMVQSLRWLWAGLWIGLAVAVLWFLFAGPTQMRWQPSAAAGCLVLGLFALFFLPWPAAWSGPPLLLAGGLFWLMSRSRWSRLNKSVMDV